MQVELPSAVPLDGKLAASPFLKCNYIERAKPLSFIDETDQVSCGSPPWFTEKGISFDALGKALCPEGYGSAWPTEVCISLLLSIISVESQEESPDRDRKSSEEASPDSWRRKESLHLLLATSAYCSVASRVLRAAALFVPRSIMFDTKNKNIIAKASAADDKTGQVSVVAGSLALANDGVCVIDISKGNLRKDAIVQLQQCMEKDSLPIGERPELAVSSRATVWAFFSSDVNKRSNLKDASAYLCEDSTLDGKLLNTFDMVHKIPSFQGKEADRRASAEVFRSRENDTAPEITGSLKLHLHRAGLLQKPRFSSTATELLQAYYLLVRRSQSTGIDSGACVSLATLESLMRMASASAKLSLRDEVLEMPDATLAIYMHEKSLEAKVR
jgi:DNA replicative helicase MCM subunit Mcm2 (Cdc46/Mcm family)